MPDERLVIRLSTPNPEEFTLRVWVPPDKFKEEHKPTQGVTTYANFLMHPAVARMAGCESYVYTYAGETREDGFIPFHFAKFKGFTVVNSSGVDVTTYSTEEAALTASAALAGSTVRDDKNTPFRMLPSCKPFGWDRVVKRIEPRPDFSTPRAGVKIIEGGTGYFNAPEYYAQIESIAEGEYNTRFRRYEYFSHTPFDIGRHNSPIAQTLMVMIPGREAIMIPRCLHGAISIDRLITSVTQASGGSAQGSSSSIPGQDFPPTEPFEGWQSWVTEHDQRPQDGGYFAWKVVADPPPEPPTSVEER